MTTEKTCFRINAPDVVSETIDGEAVIINLYKGLYYNLNVTGSMIWEWVVAGASCSDILTAIGSTHSNVGPSEAASVVKLLEQLQEESLIVPVEEVSSLQIEGAQAADVFEVPQLYKYADMQDLLALDPIHDVDETGWPKQKVEALA